MCLHVRAKAGLEDEGEFLRGITGGVQEVRKSLAEDDESPENGA